MSGGTYDYAYSKVISMAEDMQIVGDVNEIISPTRVWFIHHLHLVAEAMRAVEWEDSGDTSSEETVKAIDAVMDHMRDA